MTYEEALQKINSRLRFGIKPGLERIEALCKKLGDPQKKPRFVHVAGTNGKGTTCTLIASVLTAAGYRTGLYTSPYVLDFRERFRIDGEMIPEAELIEEVKRVSPVADELEAAGDTVTEFEFITALAFDWFAQRNCDFVVLEVGLGGRFDATNVIDTPEAAAIASISLDHTAIPTRRSRSRKRVSSKRAATSCCTPCRIRPCSRPSNRRATSAAHTCIFRMKRTCR